MSFVFCCIDSQLCEGNDTICDICGKRIPPCEEDDCEHCNEDYYEYDLNEDYPNSDPEHI